MKYIMGVNDWVIQTSFFTHTHTNRVLISRVLNFGIFVLGPCFRLCPNKWQNPNKWQKNVRHLLLYYGLYLSKANLNPHKKNSVSNEISSNKKLDLSISNEKRQKKTRKSSFNQIISGWKYFLWMELVVLSVAYQFLFFRNKKLLD